MSTVVNAYYIHVNEKKKGLFDLEKNENYIESTETKLSQYFKLTTVMQCNVKIK